MANQKIVRLVVNLATSVFEKACYNVVGGKQTMNQITEGSKRSRGLGEVVERPFIHISYQSGFPQDVGVNGCRVEDVITAAIDRLQQYQAGALACEENLAAILHLDAARSALQDRIHRRQEQGVLNTNIRHETIRTEDEHHEFSATGA
jgi:hypothetical protein